MNYKDIEKLAQQRQETISKKTLAAFNGKKVTIDLPKGLHECVIKEIVINDTSVELQVETKKTPYKVVLRVNDFFLETISPLFNQLNMKVINFDDLKKKVGETIMIAASDNETDKGIFTNYRFDSNSLKSAYLAENARPIIPATENIAE